MIYPQFSSKRWLGHAHPYAHPAALVHISTWQHQCALSVAPQHQPQRFPDVSGSWKQVENLAMSAANRLSIADIAPLP